VFHGSGVKGAHGESGSASPLVWGRALSGGQWVRVADLHYGDRYGFNSVIPLTRKYKSLVVVVVFSLIIPLSTAKLHQFCRLELYEIKYNISLKDVQ